MIKFKDKLLLFFMITGLNFLTIVKLDFVTIILLFVACNLFWYWLDATFVSKSVIDELVAKNFNNIVGVNNDDKDSGSTNT